MWQGESSFSLVTTVTVNVVDPLGKKEEEEASLSSH